MEYSNWYSLSGLLANFILKLKYTLLLSKHLISKLQLNLEELSKNFKNNYHINKLENSSDQVLRYR